MEQTLTAILAEQGLKTPAKQYPASAMTAAQKLLLDSIACAIAGQNEPAIDQVVSQMAEWGGKPEASILFSNVKLPAPNAAFANSAISHAADYDDVYIPASMHVSSALVPTMLAAAEQYDVSATEMLAALIAGFECAARLGTIASQCRPKIGYLESSLIGGFGAVIAAARLAGLTPEQCTHALGINYAQICGNRQALLDSSLTKRLQPAMAARAALWAVPLAKRGITGPHNAIEGSSGLFELYFYGGQYDPAQLTMPHQQYQIERVALKRYPSCGTCHNVQIATEKIIADQGTFKLDEIKLVEIFGLGKKDDMVSRPFTLGSNPQVDAQFSAAWGVAHTLLRGPAKLADYTNNAVAADDEVIQLAQAIRYVDIPPDLPIIDIPSDYNVYTSKPQGITVCTKNGQTFQHFAYPCQTFAPGNMSMEQVVDKFFDCIEHTKSYSKQHAQKIIDAITSVTPANANALQKLLIKKK